MEYTDEEQEEWDAFVGLREAKQACVDATVILHSSRTDKEVKDAVDACRKTGAQFLSAHEKVKNKKYKYAIVYDEVVFLDHTKKDSNMDTQELSDIPMSDRRFIVWDPKDGEPRRSEDGGYLSSGCMGVIPGSTENPYLSSYGTWTEGRKPEDLAPHERCKVTYSLSGSKGDYLVIRTV